MLDFLQALISFIIVLGVLITFHEFGHYWVAKKCDVKILRFSIGFGRPIYKRLFGSDNTEFVIASLPIGGYVKMLDEREGEVPPEEQHRSFNNKPISQRIAIVIAGPLFNFIFAIFAYWLMFIIGISGLKPVIGAVEQDSLAMLAGLEVGDEIVMVEDKDTPTWSSVIDIFVAKIIEEKQVKLLLKSKQGSERYSYVDLSQISIDDMADGNLLKRLGLTPKYPEAKVMVKEVQDNGSAKNAGIMDNDQLISADDTEINNASGWVKYVQQRPDQSIKVELLRDGQTVKLELIPVSIVNEAGQTIGRVGTVVFDQIVEPNLLRATQTYPIGGAFIRSLNKTFEMSVMTLRILGKMITGEASVKNLSGPISIAKYAGQSAGLGLPIFLGFLAIVSVSLGLLNLLPIPLLDGGHLMYYIVEIIKGSPVSEATQVIGQQFGLAVLFGLMGIAFYNDIIRLVG